MVTRKLLISGRVQGVYYRASAAQQAQRFAITGHAINLPNGDVEVVAQGSEQAVKQFIAWCFNGPEGADVTSVNEFDYTSDTIKQFTIG